MPDYQNAMIYKLWCPDNELVYIGSTCNALRKRLNQHKRNKDCSCKLLFEASDNVKIELIEEFACNNKMELNRREGEIIRNTYCVNKVIAGRKKKEYYEDNKKEICEKAKKYYEDNKKEICEKAKKNYEDNKKEICEKTKKNFKEYYQKHKEKVMERHKHYYQNNKDKFKEYYENNKYKFNQQSKEYYNLKKLQNIEKN